MRSYAASPAGCPAVYLEQGKICKIWNDLEEN